MAIKVLYFLLSGSVLTDILKNKIFNAWLLIYAGIGLALAAAGHGPDKIPVVLLKMLITFVIGIFLYFLKALGGGDIKLFIVISMFLTIEELALTFILSMVFALVIGIPKMIIDRKLHQTIHFALPVLLSVLLVTYNSMLM
ncbi:prepilin peptidase [Butyrivibrio sp. NC2002]|uniref:prepilin peptidase n=1 Tax=Butyrivibrio sp. NC2002 TaxID=1410610 RepID=UPI000563BAB6|nr:prepilin peptidase [Butyrivibrio sp. NC2002]